jgi:hypothetical protein
LCEVKIVDEEFEHAGCDGWPWRVLEDAGVMFLVPFITTCRCIPPFQGVSRSVVGVVPCFESRESVLNGVGGDLAGVRGCISTEDKFICQKL